MMIDNDDNDVEQQLFTLYYHMTFSMTDHSRPSSRKSSAGPDPAGLKASIVKAIFNDLSPAKSPPPTRSKTAGAIFAPNAKVSPLKRSLDLSLSEGDLTLTDERTPVVKSCSQNLFFPGATSEKSSTSLRSLPGEREKTLSRVPRKPKEVRKEGAETEPSGRGPNAEQLSWLRACRTGDAKTCRKLLDSNPEILHYVPPHYLNYSCVHIATQGRHYDLLRLFKERGANFNAVTRSGYTPLHLAAQNQDKDTVEVLIREFGESRELDRSRGLVDVGSFETVDKQGQLGVDTRIHDLMGYTYEHYADWLDYPDYDDLVYPLICRGGSSRNSSRRPSMGSQESLASSKNSFSRHGSIRETIRGLLHIPKGLRSRSPSLNQLAV
ncbi:hypothetical protein Y032_0011g1324 [Ancylostoma ceylanicum]|uniref:Uncharacterized protein n=1 Tax=Ancylostoma ceylanicum TaxID=53326 RepID=A0A016VEG1_9BILA|nr:hypothetical protein Y032_0011g1324 [Ancylostoma ceylanicum]